MRQDAECPELEHLSERDETTVLSTQDESADAHELE